MSRPLVSVLLPVFNGERYVREAIDSILGQSLRDLELLVIDDGSTDGTQAIIDCICDPRLKLTRSTTNRGLAVSLNVGLELAKGRYIARMDADDISCPHRLARQVEFMEGHPDIGICGSWIEVVGEGASQVWKYPADTKEIHAHLLFECALAHPSVMFNRALLERACLSYDPTYPCAQDYELWSRAVQKVEMANIQEVLLLHRLHSGQIGFQQQGRQQEWAAAIRKKQLEDLGVDGTEAERKLHEAISTWTWLATAAFAKEAEAWLAKLWWANKVRHVYSDPDLGKVIAERWLAICRSVDPSSDSRFWASPLSAWADLGLKHNLKGRARRCLARLGMNRVRNSA